MLSSNPSEFHSEVPSQFYSRTNSDVHVEIRFIDGFLRVFSVTFKIHHRITFETRPDKFRRMVGEW